MKSLIISLLIWVGVCGAEELNVAILGMGGRAQDLLEKCVEVGKDAGKVIRVVAICDNHPQESIDFFVKNRLRMSPSSDYLKIFENANFYPDTDGGIAALFCRHPHIDRVFITSANYRHLDHLNAALDLSQCKELYLEKPLFRTLDEFYQFNRDVQERNILVGLTLRYALITKLISEKLLEYKDRLGKLQKVDAWEHVGFGHGFSIIMMNWRRYFSLSGGLLLDKSIYDIDLVLHYIKTLGYEPKSFTVSSEAAHRFYLKRNQHEILCKLKKNKELRLSAERWDRAPWQRLINFSYNRKGGIDWQKTLQDFFKDFPAGDNFSQSDIIPDQHKLFSTIAMNSGDHVDFALEVKLNRFAQRNQRGSRLIFEKGEIEIDMERSKMTINIEKENVCEIDLDTRGIPHAGGDTYVAQTILHTLPKDHIVAKFTDPSVQISTLMALVSENQTASHYKGVTQIDLVGDRWVIR